MRASYEYYYTQAAVGMLDLPDIGNCIISANNDNGEFYYLIIKTQLGVTRILEFGPHISGRYPTTVFSNFQQFDYNEQKIDKIIEKFLNNRRGITQAMVVEEKDISDFIKNPYDLIKGG